MSVLIRGCALLIASSRIDNCTNGFARDKRHELPIEGLTHTALGEVGHALGRDNGRGGGDEGSRVLHGSGCCCVVGFERSID
jgi:hypothetical protein